ncbi:MAG: FlgD immunoglobulin-like domain containing protein, partial [Armatimonadia bacterium]
PSVSDPSTTINGDINADGKPDVVISGALTSINYGLNITSDNNTIKGLCIQYCGYGINISGASAHHNTIISCYIGTNLTGSAPAPNDNYGIYLYGAPYTTIGGTTTSSRNVIAGNYGYGIYASRAHNLTIRALYCGVGANGTVAIPNNGYGIYATYSRHVTIGAAYSGAKNVISGNTSTGISLSYCSTARIIRSFVGTDAGAAYPVPNGGGISLSVCNDAVIGGTTAYEANVISGNAGTGISASECYNGPIIRNNKIGVDGSAISVVPNTSTGIYLSGSYKAVVGGTVVETRNIVSGNDGTGIYLDGCVESIVAGNYVGLNGAGDNEVRNQGDGVSLSNCQNSSVGGSSAGHRNVIVCEGTGVRVSGSQTSGVSVLRNYIGYTASGDIPLPCSSGVAVNNSARNVTVGLSGQGNRILAEGTGISFYRCGSGCVAGGNRVGQITGTPYGSTGIEVYAASPRLDRNNIYQQSWYGISFSAWQTKSIVVGNGIRTSAAGIQISNNAQPNLGDRGNTPTNDDGGNSFLSNTGYDIVNNTALPIKAEGNSFASTNASVIDARFIYDKLDQATYGRVDFNPLSGTIATSVRSQVASMTVAAAPTPSGGAQITVNLTADADLEVQVTNMAGRTIRVWASTAAAPGLNTLLWNGKAGSGLAVPGGLYLVTVTSRTSDGLQQKQMARVNIQR